jgi:hypothetical protein
VRRERAELQSMTAVVDADLARFKQRVKLNVGGSKFETTLSTLTRYPDSMLGAMFSGRHEVPPDDEGYVFIDRDGTHFRAILNFLRTGFVDQPRSEQAANELKREFEYYLLPSEGLLTPPRMAMVEIVRNVKTSDPYNQRPDEVRLLHKRDVEAKLNSNPQLKIISSQLNGFDGSFTTVLATVDA